MVNTLNNAATNGSDNASQVFYKRKHVELAAPPSSAHWTPSMDVWEIPQTGEIFDSYEAYLKRRDFYHQKVFTCEITGHSGLTFFDALESETQGSRELDSTFPEALRAPVLRKVQFSTISRLEQLVNWVYDEFKHDFFPGEHVMATLQTGERVEGVLRDKITFPNRFRADGSLDRPGFSQYIVVLDEEARGRHNHNEALLEPEVMFRDRRNFSKQILRSFLKNSLTKESWHGAPWTVKDKLAQEFHIATEIPTHLQQSARVAERKALALQQKKSPQEDGTTFFSYLNQKRPLDIRPGPKGQKGKMGSPTDFGSFQHGGHRLHFSNGQPAPPHMQQTVIGPDGQLQYSMGRQTQMHNGQYAYTFHPQQHPAIFQPISSMSHGRAEMMAPPPPLKFPTEDLDVPPKKDGMHRPALKFFAEELPEDAESDEEIETPKNGLKMSSMGPLLDLWNTLNVLCEVFVLDSFTFDDFVNAIRFQAHDVECELLNEIHCAVLKQIVDQNGNMHVTLPEFEEEEDESEEEEEEGEGEGEEEQSEEEEEEEEEEEAPRRRTRSSFAKEEAEKAREATPEEDKQVHQTAAMLGDRPWVDRLKERDFKDGGWQVILAGLLHQMSLEDRLKERCDDVLSHLAPMNEDPNQATALRQYSTLDVNLRVTALEMIVKMTIGTRAVREYLDRMSNHMTEIRKKKIEQQRLRKEYIDDLHQLDQERKTLAAEAAETGAAQNLNGAIEEPVDEVMETNGKAETSENTEDEAPRVLRRGADRANDRKRKREEEAARKERKEKQPKLSKEEMKLKKVLEQIDQKKNDIKDCEDAIADFNNDLREADCQRTKCLGRDRFCNRYYWFERNGMPFGGAPNTSTSSYGYANARLWVQGPDEMERNGFIDLNDRDQGMYAAEHGVTVIERKDSEEGPTHLYDAHEWGYFDDPDDLDRLIGWLDDRGNRERALRKELQLWRDVVVEYMKKMRSHLDEVEARKAAGLEEAATRVSTRTKTYVDLDTTQWQCLHWRNTAAVEQLGHLHSEGIKKERKKKGVAEVKKVTGKAANLSTRSGTSYKRR